MSLAGNSKRPSALAADRKPLDDAIEYVSKGWMPISPKVIASVKEKLKSGKYTDNRSDLVADLKKDFSLFNWFLSKLDTISETKAESSDFKQLVESLEIEKLIEVFSCTEENILHKREGGLKPQALTLKQSLTAVATAESAAEHKKLDANLAHMCAGVRQLGINLVAWNYPRIYSRALEHSTSGKETLDAALSKILGYSPMDLGSELALKWDKTGSLSAFVNQDAERIAALGPSISKTLGPKSVELFGCIELGETVASLVAPELHPEIAGELPKILSKIDKTFGKDGFEKLKKTLKTTTDNYIDSSFDGFSLEIDPKRISEISQAQLVNKLVHENAWIAKCAEQLQDKFKKVYSNISGQSVSATAINILIGEVIPSLGFTRGCVYIVENSKMKLNPIMRIGDAPLSRYRQLDCSASERSSHPVIVALGYSTPLIQEKVPVNGDFVSHVTGVFNGQDKTGVLYLEMSDKLCRSADRSEPLLYFKAVRQALMDCLNLK